MSCLSGGYKFASVLRCVGLVYTDSSYIETTVSDQIVVVALLSCIYRTLAFWCITVVVLDYITLQNLMIL